MKPKASLLEAMKTLAKMMKNTENLLKTMIFIMSFLPLTWLTNFRMFFCGIDLRFAVAVSLLSVKLLIHALATAAAAIPSKIPN